MPIILGGGSSNMSQPLKIVVGPAQREYIVIDNGAAGVTTKGSGTSTADGGWTGVTDGLNFDDAVNGAISSNGYTNPTAGNQTVPDFVALQATITASVVGSGRVTYKNPS